MSTKTKKRTRITEVEVMERLAFAQLMIDRGAWAYPSVRRDLATRDVATVEQWILELELSGDLRRFKDMGTLT